MSGRPTATDLLPIFAPGQVFLVQRSGLISRLVRWVTKSPWSHVALLAESSGILILIESTVKRGVAAVKVETILDDPSVTALLVRDLDDLSSCDRRQIVQMAWLQTGDAYDNAVNLDILWRRLTNLPGILNRRRAKNCAELVVRAYALGKGLSLIRGDSDPTPEALAESQNLTDRWRWKEGA